MCTRIASIVFFCIKQPSVIGTCAMHKSLVIILLALLSLGTAACQTIDYPLQNTERDDDW